MALNIFHSPYHFFDPFAADYIRRMNAEMNLMRRRMFQLVPPELLMVPVFTGREDDDQHELEPQLPIVEENGERKLKMQFNVKDYKPEEVKVKMLENNVLQVTANHEEKKEDGQTSRRLFVRQYRLPKGVDVEQLKPSLSKDGVLTVEAPVAASLQPAEKLIPIEYKQ
jgi:HSP20 family molecular chaperone IbpA